MTDQTHAAVVDGGVTGHSDLIPAAMVPKAAVPAPVVTLRSGFGRPSQPTVLDPKALLKSFQRRWAMALGLGVVMAGLIGAGAWFLLPPPVYTSKALLKVSMTPPKVLFSTAEVFADFATFRKTQTELIKSRVVLGPAIRDPDVQKLPIVKAQADPQEWLEKEIHVDFSGSELLTISMSSKTPDELNTIVDAVVKSYMESVVEGDHTSRINRLNMLTGLLNQKQTDLQNKRQLLRDMSAVIGTEDRTVMLLKQQFAHDTLHSLMRDQQAIETELRKYAIYNEVVDQQGKDKAKAAAASAPVPAGIPPTLARIPEPGEAAPTSSNPADPAALDPEIENRIEADPRTLTLQADLKEANKRYQRLKGLARDPNDAAVRPAAQNLRSIAEELAAHKVRLRRGLTDAIALGANATPGVPGGAKDLSQAELFRQKIDLLKRHAVETGKEIERQRQEVSKLNGQTLDLQTEQDNLATTSATARKVAEEVEGLKVELEAPRRIKILLSADPPRKKDSAKQYMICGGASFGGFALAILAVSFWEMRAMRIGSVSEVVNNLGLNLVGTLPTLPSRTGKLKKADDQRWQGLLVESIDATRIMLLHASRVNSTRAVMITSAMKGEGKTSLAAHLATSLARAGRKTLLIDCDLRRPTLHQLFDVPRVPGICELLRGEAEIVDVVRPTPAEELNLMPAGHCDGVALQAIAQDGFREVLALLKKQYDFIIIDSAPILPVVDTLLLSQQADAVLFSIMRDVSRVPHVQAAHERLNSLGVRILGAVVSAAEKRDYAHNYDYDYQPTEVG